MMLMSILPNWKSEFRMKQKLALIPVLLLFGCSRITDDMQTRLNDKLADAAETEINYTNYSPLFFIVANCFPYLAASFS